MPLVKSEMGMESLDYTMDCLFFEASFLENRTKINNFAVTFTFIPINEMKKMLIIAVALLGASSMHAQKLPCSVRDINKALAEHDKAVTGTSQYILRDVNADGVLDIVMRDNDSPSAGYVVLVRKGNTLSVMEYGMDGYDMLGMAPGGYSFYQHDDHMGPSGRTWNTDVTRYSKGKVVMEGSKSLTISYVGEDYDEQVDASYFLNGNEVTAEVYNKAVPADITWFCDIKDGWRMVMNGQKAGPAESDEYRIYKGEVGTYPITMYLKKDDSASGYYYYDRRPESRFALKCAKCTPQSENSGNLVVNNVVINESNAKGRHTGTFVGKLDGSSFWGTFTNYKGQQFEFRLYVH